MSLRVLVQPKLKKALTQSISSRLGLLVTGGLKTGQTPPAPSSASVAFQPEKTKAKKDS